MESVQNVAPEFQLLETLDNIEKLISRFPNKRLRQTSDFTGDKEVK